jgi:hypothetical protein
VQGHHVPQEVVSKLSPKYAAVAFALPKDLKGEMEDLHRLDFTCCITEKAGLFQSLVSLASLKDSSGMLEGLLADAGQFIAKYKELVTSCVEMVNDNTGIFQKFVERHSLIYQRCLTGEADEIQQALRSQDDGQNLEDVLGEDIDKIMTARANTFPCLQALKNLMAQGECADEEWAAMVKNCQKAHGEALGGDTYGQVYKLFTV